MTDPGNYRKQAGKSGEDTAAAALKKLGYRILERNYRTFFGEADIIAEEKGDLVFIEVKNRLSSSFGSPLASVDSRKQARLAKIALSYIKMKNLGRRNIRFDVFALKGDEHELIRNAFVSEIIYNY
jgi:putative endonuclease